MLLSKRGAAHPLDQSSTAPPAVKRPTAHTFLTGFATYSTRTKNRKDTSDLINPITRPLLMNWPTPDRRADWKEKGRKTENRRQDRGQKWCVRITRVFGR